VILSPVGPYFKDGFKPVKLFADSANVRAWPGGVGASKLGEYERTSIISIELTIFINL
jgi:branched-chain amino acid aminotransferase